MTNGTFQNGGSGWVISGDSYASTLFTNYHNGPENYFAMDLVWPLDAAVARDHARNETA